MFSYILLETHLQDNPSFARHGLAILPITRYEGNPFFGVCPGEYIHHYCPNRTTADVDDDAFTTGGRRPANLVPQKDFDGTPRGWPWVVLSLLLTLVLAIAGFVTCPQCSFFVLSLNLFVWVEEF